LDEQIESRLTELPTGTVTFLFTDVEGSTRLLKQLRERYGDVRAEHERLLRVAFEANGGQEIDTQGDSFFVAFRRARDAVAAAVAAQRALAEHRWPQGVQVRLRMGIHTGEPFAAEGRYIGLGVHRAARISAAGHGGQVLVSNATRELIEDELPLDVRLRDLGEHRLKDIDRPERLFQLEIDGLPSEFPPLKTLALQLAEAPFAGREAELARAAGTAVRRGRFRGRRAVILAAVAAAVVAGAVIVPLFTLGGGPAGDVLESISPNAVGVIDPAANAIVGEVLPSASPSSVAAGEGAIWLAHGSGQAVSRIDPDSQTLRQEIPVGSGPSGIAVGAGAVWVANSLDGSVSRIDPGTNRVVQTIKVGNGPAGIAVGLGAVWVANAGDQTISQIDPATGDVRDPTEVGVAARAVAVGAGAIWLTDEVGGAVLRIDPRSLSVVKTIPVGNGPTAATFGLGSLWVANSLDGTVSQIDARTNVVTDTIPVGSGPGDIAVGEDAVWIADEPGESVVRLDPAKGIIVRTIELGSRPTGMAIGGDALWVAAGPRAAAHRGGKLVVLVPLIDSIDPALAFTSHTWVVMTAAYHGLTAFKRVGGQEGSQLVPDLATSLPSPTNGGKTYTFEVRRGIRYSNGALVRPTHFRRAIERVFRLGSRGAGFYSGIVGGAACAATVERCDLSRGIVTDDAANTVTFHLVAPDPEFLYKLSLPFAAAVPGDTPLAATRDPIPATGPYQIAAYTLGRELRFVRNPAFRVWSEAAQPDGFPDEIVLRIQKDRSAQVTAVERGEADVAFYGPPPERLAEVKTQYASQVHALPSPSLFYLFLNTRLPPFEDARVRRALNYAIDRHVIVEAQGGPDVAQPTCQVLPPNFPGFRPYCPYSHDLERARALVEDSGTKGTEVQVWATTPGFLQPKQNRYVLSILKALGYRSSLKLIDPEIYVSTVSDSRTKAQIGALGWGADYPAASTFINSTLSCASFRPASPQNLNAAQFCDRQIDARIQEALKAQVEDPEVAGPLWAKIDREIVDQAPWIPLFSPRSIAFVSARVGNFQSHPTIGTLLEQLWLR
jgi:YVTN family beta-propeller protein